MNKRLTLIHALLWAAAIVASALMHATGVFTLLLLPALGTMALLANVGLQPRLRTTGCQEDLTDGEPST